MVPLPMNPDAAPSVVALRIHLLAPAPAPSACAVLVPAARQIPQRNQMAAQVTNLVVMRLAHGEDENFVAMVQASLQLGRGDFGDLRCGRRSFLAANAAELFVVNHLGDGAVLAANRASGILAQLELAEAHSQRIEQERSEEHTSELQSRSDLV